jgi:sulfoxide reductase heme-binding subunit YedZ
MAVTSTRGWIRRLGKNWTRLHRLGYVAALLGIVHFFWITKADDRWPTRALIVWALLMAYRIPWRRLLAKRGERRAEARAGELEAAAAVELEPVARKRTA